MNIPSNAWYRINRIFHVMLYSMFWFAVFMGVSNLFNGKSFDIRSFSLHPSIVLGILLGMFIVLMVSINENRKEKWEKEQNRKGW